MEFSDETLVEQVLSGNTDSFSILVKRYQRAVFALALSMSKNAEDARDLTQESLIKAYVNLPTLKEPSKFAAWLKRITWSTCAQWLRDTSNRRSLLTRMPKNSPKTPEDLVLEKELREIISAAIYALPEKLRLTTLLYYTDGLSYKEIASFQEVPVTTVRSRLYESRKRLRTMLAKEVIPIVKDVLKSQAPKEDFPDEVMSLLQRMAKINDVKLVMEHCDSEEEPALIVEYSKPDKLRIESETDLYVYNSGKMWHLSRKDQLVTVSSNVNLTRRFMIDYIPLWFYLFSWDLARSEYELKLEDGKEKETQILRIGEKRRDDRIIYCTPITYSKNFPEGILTSIANAELTIYAPRVIPEEEKTVKLGIDAKAFIPTFQEGRLFEYRNGRKEILPAQVTVRRLEFLEDGIPFPVEFEIQDYHGLLRRIRYRQIQLNQGIPDDRFTFNPPDDALIIDNEIFSRVDEAIAEYEASIQSDSQNVHLHTALAMLYKVRKGRGSSRVIEHLQKVLQIRPDMVRILYWLADTYRYIGQYAKALELFKSAYRLDPDMCRAYDRHHAALTEILIKLGKNEEAIQHYKRCLSSKNVSEVFKASQVHGLVTLYEKEGKLRRLIEEYQREVDMNGEKPKPWLHLLLGDAYLRLNMRERAVSEFKKMLSTLKRIAPWRSLRQQTENRLKQAGMYKELTELYEGQLASPLLQAAFSIKEDIQKSLIGIYFEEEEIEKLERIYHDFRKHSSIWREAAGMTNIRGALFPFLTEAEIKKVMRKMESAGSSTLYLLMGDIYMGYFRDMERGTKMYVRACKIKPDDPETHAALGFALFKRHRYSEALKSYERSVELDQEQLYYRCYLCYVHNALSEHEKAISIGREIVKETSGDIDAHIVLGTIYFNSGEYGEAMMEFRKARELSKDMPIEGKRIEFLNKLVDVTQERL